MKTDIWIPRCDQVIKWEHDHGISNIDKRAKSEVNGNSHQGNNSTRNGHNIDNEEPILNPTSDKPLIPPIYRTQIRIKRAINHLWMQMDSYINKYMSPPWFYNKYIGKKRKSEESCQD